MPAYSEMQDAYTDTQSLWTAVGIGKMEKKECANVSMQFFANQKMEVISP